MVDAPAAGSAASPTALAAKIKVHARTRQANDIMGHHLNRQSIPRPMTCSGTGLPGLIVSAERSLYTPATAPAYRAQRRWSPMTFDTVAQGRGGLQCAVSRASPQAAPITPAASVAEPRSIPPFPPCPFRFPAGFPPADFS
jgi:hypothetical protein